jgi:hypothetical protein
MTSRSITAVVVAVERFSSLWNKGIVMSVRFNSTLHCVLALGLGALCSGKAIAADGATGEAKTNVKSSRKVKTVSPAVSRRAKVEPATTADVDLLEVEQNLRSIRAQKLAKEVAQTIDAAQKTARQDPDAALGTLKRTLTTVVSSNGIDPDVREKLRSKVQANIEQVFVLKRKVDDNRILQIERKAAVEARELATEQLLQRDEQIEQLIDKVRSLMTEGYAGNAEAFEQAEEVARASFELAPYSGVTSAAIFDSEAAGQLDKAQRLRYLRYDKLLAQLYQVELSHVPFPDEPPILYPAPEVWKALTERRQKWASVDLVRYNPTEEKIRSALSKPTTVEFLDLPLEDCITFLKEYHNINIWIDRATLTDEGVALDQPITLKLGGVTLRSVLKLLLEPAQLTYVIEDEVMKITTSTKAGEKLQTRVYPVGDLVIPIITPRAGRGGMGMMGGMGGGMRGGMGGMGGGMMGGMGGMGGMGMGMGMFNVDVTKASNTDSGEPSRSNH